MLLVTLCTEMMTSQLLFQHTYILRRPRVAIFVDIIKILIMFITEPLKTQGIRNCALKYNLYLYFLI